MKIHKICITNMASLQGQHAINFDEVSSTSNLFAITGKTGSGKLTDFAPSSAFFMIPSVFFKPKGSVVPDKKIHASVFQIILKTFYHLRGFFFLSH